MIKSNIGIIVATAIYAATFNAAGKEIIVGKSEGEYADITKAVAVAQSGDIIRIKEGVYRESVVINTPSIRVEAFDPKNPPVIDGSDRTFADENHKWEQVKDKIFRTLYRWPNQRPSGKQFMSYSGGVSYAPLMVYEDGELLRGYRNRHDKKYAEKNSRSDDLGGTMVFGEYMDWDDLNPMLTKGLLPPVWVKPDIRIPGRFMYKEKEGELYVWSAKEDNPEKHVYNIPVLFNLIQINASNVVLHGLVLQYSSGYAIVLKNAADCAIENCILENNYYAILAQNCKDIIIADNVIRQRGMYERYWYDDCKGTLLWSNAVNLDNLKSSGGKVCRNVISGFYLALRPASPGVEIYNNIISYALSGSINCTEVKNMPPDFKLNVFIYNNIFHHIDLQGIGVSFIENGPVYIYRNIFYAANSMLKTGGQNVSEVKGKTYFYHNTCVFSNAVCDNPYVFAGENVHCDNNIFHNNWYRFGRFHAWHRKDPQNFSYFPFSKGPRFDFNVYWATGDKYVGMGFFGGTEIKTLAELQQKVGIDQHSVFADPKLAILKNPGINVSTLKLDELSYMKREDILAGNYASLFEEHFDRICRNFVLEAGSPCINAAAELASELKDSMPPSDGKPDVGAMEYGRRETLLLK